MPEDITFGVTDLTAELSTNPTALDFSETGNPVLFVAQQNGTIYRYEIERQPDGPDADTSPDFVVTSTVAINVIKNDTQNFNDDGSLNTSAQRQMTGLVATTDAAGNDVLYVTSSDWRIAVGEDSGLDTNSSQIHRIVLDPDTGEVLSNVAIVRGLPRSEENHAINGLDLSVDPDTGDTYLWVSIGGNTNKGAPGNNFAGTVDFAYSASIIKINLTELDSYDIRTDANGNLFVLDMPTLDDPSRSNVDLASLGIQNLNLDPNFTLDDNGSINGVLQPDWAGGNNGLNMAKITDYVLVSEGGQLKLVSNPLSIHAPGFRNPYDVLVTEDGQVYTWDNGPNGGWGGQPISYSDGSVVNDWTSEFATNEFSELSSSGYGDQLHYLGEITDEYGPYGGHPNPIRAAAEALSLAFNSDGSYAGATSGSPIMAYGEVLFANEAEARDFLSELLIIYEQQGDGNWVDVSGTTGLPADFFDVVSGYGWEQPGGSVSNVLAFFDGTSVMDGTAYSPEAELLNNTEDGSLLTLPESTNGLEEYTATFFGGALQNTIIAASFDGTLYFTKVEDTDGDGRMDSASVVYELSNFGSQPLAVTALGDDGLGTFIDNDGDGLDDFAGLIVSGVYGKDNIAIFIPGGEPLDPGDDLDLDGVNNILDSHVGDPTDGTGVVVGPNGSAKWDFELNNPASTPPGAVPSGDSIAGGIGVNAVWRNNVLPGTDNAGDPTQGLYNGGVFNLGGASSFVSIDEAYSGTAVGAANTQQDVLGIGFMSSGAQQLAITSEMVNIFTYSLNNDAPAKTWDGGEKVGLMVGPGDQDTFVEATIAVVDDGGTIKYGVQLIVEENNSFVSSFVEVPGIENPAILGVGDPNFEVAIDLDLTTGAETATARARYVNNGVYTAWVPTATLALPTAVVEAVNGEYDNLGAITGAVVGMVASTETGDDSFAASWDWIEVTNTSDGEVVHRWVGGNADVAATDGGMDWSSSTSVLVAGTTSVSTFNITTLDASVPSTAPVGIFTQERWAQPTGEGMQYEFAVDPGSYAIRLYMGNGYAGTDQIGERLFDVSIEGALFLNDFDLIQAFGDGVGGMVQWTGQINDGIADIDFATVFENPLINAIEILAIDSVEQGPAISVGDAVAGEGDGSVTVAISASNYVPSDSTVLVQFEVRPVSATAVSDYTVEGATLNTATGIYSGTRQIAGGSADASVQVNILDDALVEGTESFEVVITAVTGANASIGDESATVTILDNDSSSGGPTGDGAVTLAITANSNNVQKSNYDSGSFVLSNVGNKVVTKVEIDVTGAVLKDAVFDPFGVAGDTVAKVLTINSAGGTGVVAPNNDASDPNNETYVGAGGIAGYEGIVLTFDQGSSGGFQSGETVTFSVDMDPNSIAGARKSPLDAGTDPAWDVGGVSGAELIGSSFTVTYADGTTSTGYLQGTGNQAGAKGLSSQQVAGTEAGIVVNGLSEGGVGTYSASDFSMLVSGPAGATMRVVLMKGMIQPTTNVFYTGTSADQDYAPQLDAQLAALAASDFAANNAVEFQTVDVTLTGGVQDISSQFDLSGVAAYDFAGENELPLGIVAALIDPSNENLPVGPTSAPIYLSYDPDSSSGGGSGGGGTPIGDPFRVEAEDMTLVQGFAVFSNPHASGGQLIQATDPGTQIASYSVTTAGTFDILLGYFDESDGQSTLNVLVNGTVVDSFTWDLDAGDATVNASSYAEHMISGIALAVGDTLQLSGVSGGGEPLRIDFAEFTPVEDGSGSGTGGGGTGGGDTGGGGTGGGGTPAGDPFRVEAEDLTLVQGFAVFGNPHASGDQLIQATDPGTQIASYTVTEAGSFDLTLGYFDESDGQSTLTVLVNGTEVDSFVWDLDAGDAVVNASSFAEHTISGLDLAVGDTLQLSGVSGGGEPLRIDYLDFQPLSGGSNSGDGGSGSAPPNPGELVHVEAESFSLDQGFIIANNVHASGGQLIQASTPDVQSASFVFADAAGVYNLTLGHFDESDGQSQLDILVNGLVVDSFVWNLDAGDATVNKSSFAEHSTLGVELEAGDVLSFTGISDGGEPLRIDYLEYIYVDGIIG
ncbi:malectin domain-containing carbohydrate-binding protein [Alloyangia pacifica]|uniref:malectin domain-containing carbohydrate-binding protein n=1 Tax=Alloyangia pacifica TaxID=311180 RepID=UPI001CFE8AD1|nr:malectin domain-containing carbohydrate-binding protein [Alloyangia pacifica]